MRDAVVRFFDLNEAWLGRVLEEGRAQGAVRFSGSARTEARLIIGALEGAMLVARPYGEPERFEAAAKRLLATLTTPAQDGVPTA
jgi:TetR/AcrR family transcriptional repressor of nem operon